jgi:glycosyltransferase involved in cell wall biosynthesis
VTRSRDLRTDVSHPPALSLTLDVPRTAAHDRMRARSAASGVQRIHIFTFRDRDDPEAGGSEEHAYWVCRHLAIAGLDVTLHTARVPGSPATVQRDGFRVVRRGGRLGVFISSMLDERLGRLGPCDAVVDIFHGAPFLAPLWARKRPQVAVVHHVHLGTWHWVLPGPLGRIGHAVERFSVPLVYHNIPMITAAASARDEIITHYKARPERVIIAPHGIAPRFGPGGTRSATPLVVAVGRFMPQKGFQDLLPILAAVHRRVPACEVVVVGDGPHRGLLEAQAGSLGALGPDPWLRFAGRVDDRELVDWYRRAWVVTSASRREGFGLTLTEAAACGTPVVASRIPGHVDACDDGVSGLLASTPGEFADAVERILTDADLRSKLGAGALAHAARFRWDESAEVLLDALCAEADRRR